MKIHYQRGDIARFKGDAIVNAANVVMLGGGGVDGVIHHAAGPDLKTYIAANFPTGINGVRCPTGEARITDGFNLRAKKIIHTVGPIFQDSPTARNVVYPGEIAERASLKEIEPRDLLAKSIRSCFEIAEREGIKTLAIPAISCGVFGCRVSTFAKVLHEVVGEKEWPLDLWVVLYQPWEFTEFRHTWDFLTEQPQ